MKKQLENTFYEVLLQLMALIKELDEDKRSLAMLFYSEAVRNIATVFNLLSMEGDKINDLVFNIRSFDDE